jgi:hypothetical protein
MDTGAELGEAAPGEADVFDSGGGPSDSSLEALGDGGAADAFDAPHEAGESKDGESKDGESRDVAPEEAAPPCGAGTCSGCCDSDGGCALGVTTLACGMGGVSCAVCTGSQLCVNHPPQGWICF